MARQMWRDLERIFRSKPRDEWVAILKRADLPVMPAKPPGELFDNEQILANDLIVEVEDPNRRSAAGDRNRSEVCPNPRPRCRPAPRLGEHTDAILTAAGYWPVAITTLRQQRVIG